MIDENGWVVPVLRDFIGSLPKDFPYFTVGSTVLVSYTSKVGYMRKIKDIDIICSDLNFNSIADKLKEKGYEQNTFIDKSMPFYKSLKKLAETKYYRFVKNDKSLEIMTSDFKKSDKEVGIELYPNIKFFFPSDAISSTDLNGISFNAVTPEALYCIYSLGHNTWGKIAAKGKEKREEDIKQLSLVINPEKVKKIANKIYICLGKFKFKIPLFLVS